jgi:hypothetical protein
MGRSAIKRRNEDYSQSCHLIQLHRILMSLLRDLMSRTLPCLDIEILAKPDSLSFTCDRIILSQNPSFTVTSSIAKLLSLPFRRVDLIGATFNRVRHHLWALLVSRRVRFCPSVMPMQSLVTRLLSTWSKPNTLLRTGMCNWDWLGYCFV